ncbi:MAG: hydroxyacid dehydrogenase [Sphaerochaetaceae bacterium]
MGFKRTVLLPQPIEQEADQYLQDAGCNIIRCNSCTFEEVGEKLKEAEAVVLRTGIKFTKELLAKGTNLKVISRTGAGVDNVDLEAATEQGIIVSSSLGANTESVAEHALTMMLTLIKNIKRLDNEVRSGNFKIRYTNPSNDMTGKTLGLLGFGRIGSRLAEMCHTIFQAKIIAFDEYLPVEVQKKFESWVKFVDYETLLKEADFISIHVPLTPETRNMVDYNSMKKMKKSAFLINTSRGGIINEADLAKAMKEGLLSGAGLDVFDKEPIEENNPLLEIDNVLMTPHTAALTEECVVRMAMEGVKRVVAYFEGKESTNVANPEVLKRQK